MARAAPLAAALAALLLAAAPAPAAASGWADCDAVDATLGATSPPANAAPLFTLNAVGFRQWDCLANGSLADPAQIDGSASANSADGEWHSGFIYETRGEVAGTAAGAEPAPPGKKVAVFPFNNGAEGYFGEYWLANVSTGPPKPDGSLVDARWRLVPVFDAGMPDPKPAYMMRTNTAGGATPASCPPGAPLVRVPYTCDYIVYSCGGAGAGGAPPENYAAAAGEGCAAGAGVPPPLGAALTLPTRAEGARLFSCAGGGVNPGEYCGEAAVAGLPPAGGWAGPLRYAGFVALVDLARNRTVPSPGGGAPTAVTERWWLRVDTNSTAPGAVFVEPNAANATALGGVLKRFRVDFSACSPAPGADPAPGDCTADAAWIVQEGATGGVTPTSCPAGEVEDAVPYSIWFNFYSCGGGGGNGTAASGAVRPARAAGLAAAVAAAAALLAL